MVNAVNGSLGSGGVEYANLMSDMTQTVSDGATDPVEEPVIFDINNYTLLGWCYQIACGMDYLAKHNKFYMIFFVVGIICTKVQVFPVSDLKPSIWSIMQVLHGDLAARNILLAENNIVKISDFGLSKSLYNYQYKANFKKPMPIKWMAIESLRDGIFSTQSDVWAYGVVMWEVFSLGQVPYPTIDLNKNFVNQLESGVRLHKPQYASEKLYVTLQRPKFDALQELLQAFMDDKTRKYYEDMNVTDNEPVENSLLSRVRSPDIRAMSIDADGYEVPKQHPDSGLYENGMLHRNINSLSLTIPPNNPGYYTLGSNELQSEKTPVLYKQASRLEKRESETSSGIGSLHGPSFDS
ncbi:hypothetical protein HAZT_HAZT004998, partial [Hyalella azteca]